MRHLVILVAASVFAASCGGGRSVVEQILQPIPPSGEAGPKPVEEVLETAVEASHLSTLALVGLDGGVACTTVVSGCVETGCDFRLEIDVGACPSPIASDGSGIVVVTGTRTGPDSATLDATFGNLQLGGGGGSWFVAGIGALVAERSGDRVSVVYAQQNVSITAGCSAASTELSQHVWTSDVALAGTPADTSDDVYTISGGLQDEDAGTGGVHVLQAALAAAQVTPACRRNPTTGSTFIQRAGVDSSIIVSMLDVGFHADCDGKADVLSAFGTDMFSIGGTVPMDLVH